MFRPDADILAAVHFTGLNDIIDDVLNAAEKEGITKGDEYFIAFCRGIARAVDIVAAYKDPETGELLCGALEREGHVITHYRGRSWVINDLARLCYRYAADDLNLGVARSEELVDYFFNDPRYGNTKVDDNFRREKMYQSFRYYARGYIS